MTDWKIGCLRRLKALIKVINMLATFKAFAHKSRRAEYDWGIIAQCTTRHTVLSAGTIFRKNIQSNNFPRRMYSNNIQFQSHILWVNIVIDMQNLKLCVLICYKDVSFGQLRAVLVRLSHISFVDNATSRRTTW